MGERRVRLALLWAGLRWRAGSSLAMLAVGALAVLVGALGPVYLHAADQSVLESTLGTAPVGNTGLTILGTRGGTSTRPLEAVAHAVPRSPGGSPWFGAPVSTLDVGFSTLAKGQAYASDLVSRSGSCAHLVVVRGRCADTARSLMLSTRSARELGVQVGREIDIRIAGTRRPVPVTISGLYRATDPAAPYWWGANYFAFGTEARIAEGTGTALVPALDAAFTVPATVRAVVPRARAATVATMVQVPLRVTSVTEGDAAALRRSVQRLARTAVRSHASLGSQLPGLLGRVASIQRTMTTVAAAIDLQLLVLALMTLYFVAARTSAEREPDIRLAELRGYRPRSVFGVALAEPVAITLAALPLGLAAAWLVARVTAPVLLADHVGAPLTAEAVLAAAATAAAGVVAMGIGARALVSAAYAGGGAEARALERRSSLWRTVAAVGVIAVAVAAFFELVLVGVSGRAGSGHADPLAALAPGILAVAVGIVGARLAVGLVRRTLAFTRNTRAAAITVATRRIARGGEFTMQVVMVAVAVSLSTFGVIGWRVADVNRAVRSAFDVGADRVLTVDVRPGVDFVRAVRTADRGAHSAMAAVVEAASDGETLAVDASRMPQVMSWPSALSRAGVAALARRLVPAGLRPVVTVTGDQLAVTASSAFGARPAPVLSADLLDDAYGTTQQVTLGALVPRRATYRGGIPGGCPGGCRLVDLGVEWSGPAAAVASEPLTVTVSSVESRSGSGRWRPVAAGLGAPHGWTPLTGGVRLAPGAAGLGARVALSPFGPAEFGPDDVPVALPAITTPADAVAPGSGPGALNLVGLDGATVTGRQVATVPALPRVGVGADLVDLPVAQRLMSGPLVNATAEVWLSGGAPGSIAQRLAARGVVVVGQQTAAQRARTLSATGVSLAYSFFIVAAVAAAVLAVGITAFVLSVTSRRRATELAALRVIGLRARTLRRSIAAEQLITLATAMVLGVGTGIAASAVALRSLPEFAGAGPRPPLDLSLPLFAIGGVVVVLAVALAAAVAVGTAVAVDRSTYLRLGGGQL